MERKYNLDLENLRMKYEHDVLHQVSEGDVEKRLERLVQDLQLKNEVCIFNMYCFNIINNVWTLV